jgi:REP element-mobilizing transposase RayT
VLQPAGVPPCPLFFFPELTGARVRPPRNPRPVAKTYALVLMRNHFHFLVKIKDEFEILKQGKKTISKPHQNFSNLFNAYCKAFNKRYNRHGSLFERAFKRKLINDNEYLKQVVLYIHNNPIHHGIVLDLNDYPWSSYRSGISEKPYIHSEPIKKLFNDKDRCNTTTLTENNINDIEEWLELKNS